MSGVMNDGKDVNTLFLYVVAHSIGEAAGMNPAHIFPTVANTRHQRSFCQSINCRVHFNRKLAP
jgi:hypothetical protein